MAAVVEASTAAEGEVSTAVVAVAAAFTVAAVEVSIPVVVEVFTVAAVEGLAAEAAEAIAEAAPTEVRVLSGQEVPTVVEVFVADLRSATTELATVPAEVPTADSADHVA